MTSTKNALKAIASVTDQLQAAFELPPKGSTAGVSRISAYLHILHQQVRTSAGSGNDLQQLTRPVYRSCNATSVIQPAEEAARYN